MMLWVLLICVGIVFENHNSYSRVYAWDTSEFSVRLYNSRSSNVIEGRLEIYYSGSWGTVCDNMFTRVNARVACASLGYAYIGSVISDRYRAGTDPIWLDNVNCTGIETGLEQCFHDGWGVHNCSHDKDVSISCNCGIRNFTEPTGKISSPNFPMSYGSFLDFQNYITVTSGYTVIITFLTFNTRLSSDFVTISCESGKTFRSKSYSGFEFPAVLTIVSCDILKVHFLSGGYYGHKGFSLTYNVTSDIVTGGITTKPSNTVIHLEDNDTIVFNCTTRTGYSPWWMFSDKNSKNYTITNSTCGIITSASYGSSFITKSSGPGSCNLIVVASTTYPYYPNGNLICTDSTLSSATAIIEPKDCGNRNFTKPNGKISSPRFPMAYDSNLDCYNYISVPTGQTVIIMFLAFKTDYNSDYLTISCISGNAFGSQSYSGIELPPVLTISRCNIVNVYFQSDHYNSGYTGFFLTYKTSSDIVKGGFTLKPSDAFPHIDTVLIVFNCTGATKYTPWWIFSGTQITNSKCGLITSTSTYSRWFRTETSGPGSCNLIMVASPDYPYLLAGNLVCTDSTLSTAKANIATMECGARDLSGPSGIISSPKFPLPYADNLDCHNYIIVPSGQTVIITFLEFSTYSLYDWVTIVCESGNDFRTPRFYGRHNIIPSVLTISSCSRVNVHFHSDHSGTDKGFSFTYNITQDEAYQSLKVRVSVLGSLFGIALIAIFVIVAILLLPKFRQLQIFLAAFVGHKTDGRPNEHELQQTEGENNLYANDVGNFVKVDESEYDSLDNSRAEPAVYQELRPKPKVKPRIKK